MIKKCLLLVFITILGIQCSNSFEESFREEEILFTPEIDKVGKDVALNIRKRVENMYQQRILTKSHFKNNEILKINSQLREDNILPNLKTIANRINSLSPVQKNVLKQISDAKKESCSYEEFAYKLKCINAYILQEVPEIEQIRLLVVNSIIYYSYKEINALISEGYLPQKTLLSFSRLKTPSEDLGPTSGSIGEWCKSGLSTVWLAATLEPSPFGEVVATGATIVVGGILLYEFLVYCFSNSGLSQKQCAELYSDCIQKGGKLGGECYDCYRYCETQGVWNCD